MRTKTVSLVPLLIRCTVLLILRVSLQFVMGRPIAPQGKACRAYHIVTRKLGLASIRFTPESGSKAAACPTAAFPRHIGSSCE